MKDIKYALDVFLEASNKQAEATEIGDYKTGNKWYAKVVKSAGLLKSENAIDELLDFLSNPSTGIRLWSACFLLEKHNENAVKVLKEIIKSKNIHSLTAETTLSEWEKGNLKF
jgi:HEAT repeat protein